MRTILSMLLVILVSVTAAGAAELDEVFSTVQRLDARMDSLELAAAPAPTAEPSPAAPEPSAPTAVEPAPATPPAAEPTVEPAAPTPAAPAEPSPTPTKPTEPAGVSPKEPEKVAPKAEPSKAPVRDDFYWEMRRLGVPTKTIEGLGDLTAEQKAVLEKVAYLLYKNTVQLGGPAHQQLRREIAMASQNESTMRALADFTGRLEVLEEDVPVVQSAILELADRVDRQERAINDQGISVEALKELARSAKYNKSPKESDRVDRALEEARESYVPPVFGD